MSARDDAGIAAALDVYAEAYADVRGGMAEEAASRDALLAAIESYAAGKPIAALPARAPTFDAFDADAYPDDDS